MSNRHHAHGAQAADVAAAAARLTGAPKQLGARLAALLHDPPPEARRGETSEEAADRLDAARRHEAEVAALRHRLEADFAASRGLQLSTTPMARKELARRAPLGSKWHRSASEWPGPLGHPTFYRATATRRAAAVVAHVDPAEMDVAAVKAWAAEFDLAAAFPDFPSWRHPGRTVLAVLEPADPAAAPIVPPEPEAVAAPVPSTAPAPAAPQADEPVMSQDPAPSEAQDPARNMSGNITEAPRPPAIMRPIAPLDLGDVVPRDLTDEDAPKFLEVDPRDLMVDETYQRDLSPKSLALIRRIVENWSWAKYKAPNCVWVGDQLHVVDGQHTAIAAASHPGIEAVFVIVSAMPEVADRAAAFLSHAQNRLPATHLQVHKAAVTAGDAEAVTLDDVCRRAGVELLAFAASDGRYAPRQTVAVVNLRRLVAKRGPERSVEILAALAAADLAPIAGDHIRLGEALLCDEAYADAFTPERLTEAMRGLTPKTQAEARELGIAQRLPAWRALAAVLYRNSTKPKPRGRGDAPATRRRAGA